MKIVFEAVDRGVRSFADRPLIRRLQTTGSMDSVVAFAPGLTFFVMAFQDMLRLIEKRIDDPLLKEIASQHRYEDSGHERWFINDLERLGSGRNLEWVFGPTHSRTRDAAYSLISLILSAKSDEAKLTVLLVLEATGDVFFGSIPGFLARAGMDDDLEYFGKNHLSVERAHQLHGAEVHDLVAVLELSSELQAQCAATADAAVDCMIQIADELEARVDRAERGVISSPAVPMARGEYPRELPSAVRIAAGRAMSTPVPAKRRSNK